MRLLLQPDVIPPSLLTHDEWKALARTFPADMLQWFLVTHGPCALHNPHALTVTITAHHHDHAYAEAVCGTCGAQHLVSIPHTTHPDLWWLTTTIALAEKYRDLFVHDDTSTLTDALPQCLDGLMKAITLSVMLDTTQDTDEDHTTTH